jgi:hypothetical protein
LRRFTKTTAPTATTTAPMIKIIGSMKFLLCSIYTI